MFQLIDTAGKKCFHSFMARISSRKLTPKLQNRMFYIFWKSLADLGSVRELEFLTNDLFSPVEKVMMAKRFLAAILLLQGLSFRRICSLLRLSPNTVNSVAKKIRRRNRGYGQVLTAILKRPETHKFIQGFI